MRWLLLKDLQIMRRSPLLTALLVVYPIVIAVLIGFALSRGPDKPRVAFLNEVPPDTPLNVGGEEFDLVGARSELCERIECVPVSSEEEARQKVESGDVLGALILPADLVDKLQTLAGLNPESRPSRCSSTRRTRSRRGSSTTGSAPFSPTRQPADLSGGLRRLDDLPADPPQRRRFQLPRREGLKVLGLRESESILRDVRRELPADSPDLERPRLGDPLQPPRGREPRRRRRPAELGLAADPSSTRRSSPATPRASTRSRSRSPRRSR